MLDTQGIRTEMMEFYEQKAAVYGGGGWRAVGEMIGRSGAYARQVANGDRPVTSRIAAAWMIATGGTKPKRKRYWRPCLPATLTAEQRAQVVALAHALRGKE